MSKSIPPVTPADPNGQDPNTVSYQRYGSQIGGTGAKGNAAEPTRTPLGKMSGPIKTAKG